MRKTRKVYFGAKAEASVRRYVECENEVEKREIYLKEIAPVFSKLIENIINMPKFNFKRMDNFRTLQDEVMAHLYQNLNKFNPNLRSKKTKKRVRAFSYFGTIAKNFLVQKSAKRSRTILIDDKNETEGGEHQTYNVDEISIPAPEAEIEMKEFFTVLQAVFEAEMPTYSPDKRKIADAICFFLKNVNTINVYNKKHWYLLMKEYTGLNSKKITLYLNDFKKDYLRIRKSYIDCEL